MKTIKIKILDNDLCDICNKNKFDFVMARDDKETITSKICHICASDMRQVVQDAYEMHIKVKSQVGK